MCVFADDFMDEYTGRFLTLQTVECANRNFYPLAYSGRLYDYVGGGQLGYCTLDVFYHWLLGIITPNAPSGQ